MNRRTARSNNCTIRFDYGIILAFSAMIVFATSAQAQVDDPVVLNTNDMGAGSLRQAIAGATDGSTITFDNALSGEIIRLSSNFLSIAKNLTIDGSSLAEPVTISGDADMSGTPTPGDHQVFSISAGGYSVNLYSLVISGGLASNDSGGGIKNAGSNVVIQNTTIDGNYAPGGTIAYSGGGIFQNGGSMTIVNSTISNNHVQDVNRTSGGNATGGGGGGINLSGGTLTVQNCTITQNSAGSANHDAGNATGGHGGGIFHFLGNLTVENSTIVNNTAGDATASGTSTGGSGGGIFVHAAATTTTISNSIISQNLAGSGGTTNGSGADIQRGNSDIVKSGNNLVGDNDTVESEFPDPAVPGEANDNGDLVGVLPQLQPLDNYGGRTKTLMPYFDSIVVDAGIAADRPQDTTDINWNLNLTELLPVDQTGSPRVSGSELDLGAFEYQFPTPDMSPVVDPTKVFFEAKVKKLEKKIKKLKKKGKTAKGKKLAKKLKKLKKKVAALG